MDSLFHELIKANEEINNIFGRPSFTWNGASYYFVPNVYEFQRELVDGGSATDLMMKATVNRYNHYGQPNFPNDVIPSPQQTIQYNGLNFRIEAIKPSNVFDPSNPTNNSNSFMIIAVSTTRGVGR